MIKEIAFGGGHVLFAKIRNSVASFLPFRILSLRNLRARFDRSEEKKHNYWRSSKSPTLCLLTHCSRMIGHRTHRLSLRQCHDMANEPNICRLGSIPISPPCLPLHVCYHSRHRNRHLCVESDANMLRQVLLPQSHRISNRRHYNSIVLSTRR